MKKRYILVIIIGKAVRVVSRLFGNGGSALPGLVVEKIAPSFISETLKELPDGVIVITGTNGKTTTTKIITELLESQNKKVLTNRTGSNFTRGIIAAIISEYSLRVGSFNKDVAVLELDEAYARLFVELVKPDYVVGLNVMRDQLDRFGELEVTTRLIAGVLESATKGCIINGDEPELVAVGNYLEVPVTYYGVEPKLRALFPTDAELLKVTEDSSERKQETFAVRLESFTDKTVSYKINGKVHEVSIKLTGQYNYNNAAAALSLVITIMPNVKVSDWLKALENIEPAFGRGEAIMIGDRKLELMLVKNPGGFRQALASHDSKALTMMAINDNHADGRDVSWLWDVDFSQYDSNIFIASGIRANDMALRLQYDNIKVEEVENNLERALTKLLAADSDLPCRIFCTYTAMLTLRQKIGQLTEIKPSL